MKHTLPCTTLNAAVVILAMILTTAATAEPVVGSFALPQRISATELKRMLVDLTISADDYHALRPTNLR